MSNSSAPIEILSRCFNNPGATPTFNGRTADFVLTDVNQSEIEAACQQIGLQPDFQIDNRCQLNLTLPLENGTLFLFFDDKDFVNRGSKLLDDFGNRHYIILVNPAGTIEKIPNEIFTIEKSLLFNLYNFSRLFHFLSSHRDFVSIKSDADRQFIIFSSDKGPFHIGYKLSENRVQHLENLSPVYDLVVTEFNKIEFVQFIKSAVINTIHQYAIADRFFYLVQSLRVILNIAERDHYIYVKSFDFEKIKAKFKDSRNKYFESLEKNIDAISKQVTSFPLTFAASIFAANQVKDKSPILVLIFAAYCLYTLVAWRILGITDLNIENTKRDVQNEESKIRSGYELLYTDFENDFSQIYSKIIKIENLSSILKVVLLGLLLIFIVFSAYEMFFVPHIIDSPAKAH